MPKADETKLRLVEAFNQLLAEVPCDQITVSGITERCGLSRQVFYYHFHNLYELVIWSLRQYVSSAIARSRSSDWNSLLRIMLEGLYERRQLVEKVMDEVDRSVVDRTLKDELGVLAMRMVEEVATPMGIAQADRSLIARFYTAGTVEIVEAWLDDGMRESPERLSRRLEVLLDGGMTGAMIRMQHTTSA